MKKYSLIILLFIISFQLKAQLTDTIFFDKDWEIIELKENASFYRVIVNKKKSSYTVKDYYISGKIQMEGRYADKKLKIRNGFFKYYSESGNLSATGSYKKNIIDSKWEYYFSNGQKSATKIYTNGICMDASFYDKKGNEVPIEKAEYPPRIKWENNNLNDYIKEQIPKYNTQGNKGKVEVILNINKNGEITKIIVKDNPNPLLKDIAHKIINNMPSFIPGKLHNRMAKYYVAATFKFKKSKPK